MTVYEYMQDQATVARSCAGKAESKDMHDVHLADADKWERRARALTVETGAQLIEDAILWRIIEEADKCAPPPSLIAKLRVGVGDCSERPREDLGGLDADGRKTGPDEAQQERECDREKIKLFAAKLSKFITDKAPVVEDFELYAPFAELLGKVGNILDAMKELG